ncbi:RNA polymerase sigma factor [candidate division KSB1 bacterium]
MFQAQSGDLDKLGLLYKRHNKTLFGFFYRTTFSVDVSEDLTQNVFYRIVKYRDRFRGEGKFTTWMYSIAHNVLSDHFRKNSRIEYHDDITEFDLPDSEDLDTQIVVREQKALLKDALKELKTDQREALIMSKYQGLKCREIAAIFNCTENVVKSRIFRAINKLTEIISDIEK